MSVEQLDILKPKFEPQPKPNMLYKNSKWVIDLNVKHKTTQLSKENMPESH